MTSAILLFIHDSYKVFQRAVLEYTDVPGFYTHQPGSLGYRVSFYDPEFYDFALIFVKFVQGTSYE